MRITSSFIAIALVLFAGVAQADITTQKFKVSIQCRQNVAHALRTNWRLHILSLSREGLKETSNVGSQFYTSYTIAVTAQNESLESRHALVYVSDAKTCKVQRLYVPQD